MAKTFCMFIFFLISWAVVHPTPERFSLYARGVPSAYRTNSHNREVWYSRPKSSFFWDARDLRVQYQRLFNTNLRHPTQLCSLTLPCYFRVKAILYVFWLPSRNYRSLIPDSRSARACYESLWAGSVIGVTSVVRFPVGLIGLVCYLLGFVSLSCVYTGIGWRKDLVYIENPRGTPGNITWYHKCRLCKNFRKLNF